MSDARARSTPPLPLAGVSVLDFSTLLPGPLATLMLVESGAEVIKVERPDGGDMVRSVPPMLEHDVSVRYALLNRGKRAIALDLKRERDRERAVELALAADVLVEQFRPGVMDRLGLGYERLRREHPGLIYCSITGYGQSGPKAQVPAHDLNYQADAGLLSLVRGEHGEPPLPAATFADIAGGSYPAVINVLLALIARTRTGRGAHIDVAMSENMLPFVYWGLGNGELGAWPSPGGELLTGGSPRYRLYRTRDGGHVAVAAIEDRFWRALCELIELPAALRDDARDPAASIRGVAAAIGERTAAQWEALLAGAQACASVVRSLRETRDDEHLAARGVFDRRVAAGGERQIAAMHVPIDPALRDSGTLRDAPSGEARPRVRGAAGGERGA